MNAFQKKRDVYFSFCAILVSAFLLCKSLTYASESAVFPLFLTSLMLLLAVLLLIKTLREQVVHGEDTSAVVAFWGTVKCALWVISATAAYVAGIIYLGYFVSTAVFFLSIMLGYGKNAWLPSLLSTVGFLAIIYGLFVSFLGISLPQGILV